MTASSRPLRRLLGAAAALALGAGLAPALTPAALADPVTPGEIVIDEVYGGGGNSGATLTHDFVELRNTSAQDVSLDGWSLQYASADRGVFSASSLLELEGTIPADSSYLIELAAGAGGTEPLPTADLTGGIAVSSTGGTVALSDDEAVLDCTGTACAQDPGVVDLLGWGGAITYAGTAPAPATQNTTSVTREGMSGDNAADFVVADPSPTNSAGDSAGGEDPGEDEGPGEDGGTAPAPEPGEVVPIEQIQGEGASSPMEGQTVTTEGVVTAAYPTGGMDGYVIQTGGTGGPLDLSEHSASQALFVYSPQTAAEVEIGQSVQVTGEVGEYYDSTQITVGSSGLAAADDLGAVKPLTLEQFPTDEAERESIEHMLYLPGEDAFTVTDVYGTSTYGEVGLAIGEEPYVQPGDIMEPGEEATALYEQQLEEMVLLDDGKTTNFTQATDEPVSYLSLEEPLRVGAGLSFTEPVVLGYSFDTWRLQPTSPWESAEADGIDVEDTREAEPQDVGGDLQVGTFNVLNYFTTLGEDTEGCQAYTDRDGTPVSVRGGCDPRGAWSAEDLQRQQDKIVEAISTSGLDVVGLMEIENSARLGEDADAATATLVDALNARDGEGAWAFVPTGEAYEKQGIDAGGDVISNAIIYRTDAAAPTGQAQILAGDDAFSNAREPIGQVFTPVVGGGEGEPFLFVVNHFKSKGSEDDWDAALEDDPVQGNARTSRQNQAEALVRWVEGVQEQQGVEDVLLGGDFNAYTQETAMQTIYDAGYTDLISEHDESGWSYSYDGLVGSLDHVVANDSARERVTGATDWSINAPESPLLQYSRINANVTDLYEDGPYASSDHNPLIVGLGAGSAEDGAGSPAPGCLPTPTPPPFADGEHPGRGKGPFQDGEHPRDQQGGARPCWHGDR